MKKCNECSQYKKCEVTKIDDCNFLKYSLKHFQYCSKEKLCEKEVIENFPNPDKQSQKLDLLTDSILHLRSRYTYKEISEILQLSTRQVRRKMSALKKNFNKH